MFQNSVFTFKNSVIYENTSVALNTFNFQTVFSRLKQGFVAKRYFLTILNDRVTYYSNIFLWLSDLNITGHYTSFEEVLEDEGSLGGSPGFGESRPDSHRHSGV